MSGYRRRLRPGEAGEGDPVERGLEAEIEAHLQMRTEALIRTGMDPAEARAEAERRFGDGADVRRKLLGEARRAQRRRGARRAVDALATDVRLAVRRARRAPGFTAVALTVFAGSVGLATAVVTVADNVLARPLPFPEPDALVALWSVSEQGSAFRWVSMSNWVDWKEGAAAIESTAIHAVHRGAITTPEDAFHAPVARVAGAFFRTLRPGFVVGRGFTEEESQTEQPVAVVGRGFWTRVLGGRRDLDALPDLVVDGRPVRVVGVVEDDRAFPAGTEVWIPHRYRAGGGALRNNINYEAVARLRPDRTLEQARAQLEAVARDIRDTDPEALYSWGVGVYPLRTVVVGDARSYLVMLLAAVGFLLAVACANLAGLSLARARRHAREIAVHLALGARRSRLIRRVVTEHLLLGLVGGGLGILVAWGATDLLMRPLGAIVPRAEEVVFDLRVASLGIAVALAAGLLAGLVPAVRGSRGELAGVLSGTRGGVGGGRGLPGALMVATEIALAVALLIGGGLLFRSFQALVGRDLGFDPVGVQTATVSLVGPEWEDGDRRAQFWREVVEGVRTTPGVTSAALARDVPTMNGGRGFVDLEGREGADVGAGYFVVGEGYFRTMGIGLVRGRAFGSADDLGTERVTVVNRAMAEEFWPGEDPIGQRVRARSMEQWIFESREAPWLTVIGVVENVLQYGFESEVQSDMFVLDRQVPYYTRAMTVVARSAPGAPAPSGAVRRAVRAVDPTVPVEAIPMEARLARQTGERRLMLSGLGLFGGAAVLLACLGIYGLMSFAVGERKRETAVRMALGAERSGIVRLLLGSALRVVAAGAAAGLFGGWAFTRLLESWLVDVTRTDARAYVVAVVVLGAVAMMAAAVPSMRSARLDPVEALRSE